MKNKGFIAAIIILVLLILLLLFWHPLDGQKTTATTEAKADSTTVTDTPDKPQDTTNGKSKQQKPPKQQPPTKNSGGGTNTIIIKIVDGTTGKNLTPTNGQIEVQTGNNDATLTKTQKPSIESRTGSTSITPFLEVNFRLNQNGGNWWPEKQMNDEIGDNAQEILATFPESVWNNTGDGHNLRFYSFTSEPTGNYGGTTDGRIFLKASLIEGSYLHTDWVEVTSNWSKWSLVRMEKVGNYYIWRK